MWHALKKHGGEVAGSLELKVFWMGGKIQWCKGICRNGWTVLLVSTAVQFLVYCDFVCREINGLCLCIKMGNIQSSESCTDATQGTAAYTSSPAHGYLHRSNTHTVVLLLFWNLFGTTRVSRYQKGKTILDLLEQEIVNGSGICWAICNAYSLWPHARSPPVGDTWVHLP